MVRKLLLTIISCCVFLFSLRSQTPYHELAKDTIVTRPVFMGNTYLLDGKKLNIQVMQWFMTDHPLAHDQIRGAVLTDQLAAVSFTIGGIIFLGGVLIRQDDQGVGEDLMLMGGAGIGAGLLFSIVSGGHQHRAVQLYNEDIKRYYNPSAGVEWQFGLSGSGLTLRLM